MFYLPRICEHCLNPSCVAVCPSGALYKRIEDGIVLVDQDRCRGWRMCVTGCPYKKVYFNHRTGKAEKCTLCYPRIEAGQPTVCSETCVGRLRYLGVILYDADKVGEAAATPDEQDLYEAQLGCFLDPDDPGVRRAAEEAGIPHDWITAARNSPVHALISRYKVALPLHPEYRTMPMVWYIPPLSPVVEALTATGHDGEDPGKSLRRHRLPAHPPRPTSPGCSPPATRPGRGGAVPAGRDAHLHAPDQPRGGAGPGHRPPRSGWTPGIQALYRLLALAKYEERYVIPTSYTAEPGGPVDLGCSLDEAGGPGMYDVTVPQHLAARHARP